MRLLTRSSSSAAVAARAVLQLQEIRLAIARDIAGAMLYEDDRSFGFLPVTLRHQRIADFRRMPLLPVRCPSGAKTSVDVLLSEIPTVRYTVGRFARSLGKDDSKKRRCL